MITMNLISVLLQAQAGGGSPLQMILMIVLMIGAMWFFMIRPQQKQQKKEQAFRASLRKGDEVVTASGLYGTIKEISDFYVMLEIAHNVVVKVNINSIYPSGNSASETASK